MDKNVIDNNKIFLDRIALNKSLGYDTQKERDFILECSKPFSGRILEIGTGKGYFTLALAKSGAKFVSIDKSADEQRFAKLNLVYAGLENNVDFRIGDAAAMPFKSGSYDLIFMVNVLHHLTDSIRVLKEIFRLLAVEGRVIISDFNENGFSIMDKLHGLEGKKHEVSGFTINEAEKFMKVNLFLVKRYTSNYQEVISGLKYKEEVL